jgi:hypothetical protein
MSTQKKISKKETLKLISLGIENGETKQEIFNRLSTEYSDSDTIAKLVATFPDPELKAKYDGINNILFALLIITGILKVIAVLPIMLNNTGLGLIMILIVPILNILFAIEVKRTRGPIYRALGALAIVGILKSFQHIEDSGNWILIDVGLLAIISGLSFYIGSKMFPNYGFMGPKKDNSGNWKF